MDRSFYSFRDLGRALKSTAYAYKVLIPPVNLPVNLITVKEHLRLDLANVTQDDYLTKLTRACSELFERYTNKILITTQFRTFRDSFSDGFEYNRLSQCFEIRRSPLQSVVSIMYLKDGVFTLIVSDTYDVTDETGYSRIVLAEDKNWPIDKDNRLQSIQIIFDAGFGDDDTDIPANIQLGLLHHISMLYENRGDCDQGSLSAFDSLPIDTRLAYTQYKVQSIVGNTWRC